MTFIEKYAIIELYSKHKVKLFLNTDFRLSVTLSNVSDLYSLFSIPSFVVQIIQYPLIGASSILPFVVCGVIHHQNLVFFIGYPPYLVYIDDYVLPSVSLKTD